MIIETKTRTIIKSLSYRVVGSLTTGGLVFLFTSKMSLAATVGLLEAFSKVAIFYFHDRAWSRVRLGLSEIDPFVVWITGFSGSGKSAIGEELTRLLKKKKYKVEHIDGDNVRKLIPSAGFSRADRNVNIERIALLSRYLERNGVFVVCTLMAPYEESRESVKKLCKNLFEVHVCTPLEVCEQRDTKGLYKQAREGKLKNWVGIDEPYDPPKNPDVTVDTTQMSPCEAAQIIFQKLMKRAS